MLLDINNLSFSHQEKPALFTDFNLQIEENKIIALAGESGCGKSTLLSLIYGLLNWEKGDIFFDGQKLLGPKGNLVPGEPDMKFVAQNFDLMPYATVAENVGKFLSNINLAKKRETVRELLEVVGMEEYADILPKYLSGGQQQRVAIARALSVLPKLLLLDEPFSNLDFARKIELRERLFSYVKKNNISLIISTHELQDILPWLDQIIILKEGRILQNGSVEEIYKNAQSPYVAKLFGEVNIFTPPQMFVLDIQKFYYYPHQIIFSENGIEVDIVESRFAGSYYWNKLLYKDIEIIVYSRIKISGKTKIIFSK